MRYTQSLTLNKPIKHSMLGVDVLSHWQAASAAL